METRFVESFLVVVQSGSIAEAARRLNMTTAALTQRIRALEAEIGTRLLTRAGQTVQPTEAGRAILDQAQQLLSDARQLCALATADTATGHLRLGAISTAILGIMPIILTFIANHSPKLEIYVMPGTSADLYARVLSGDIDAAVLVEPPFGLRKTCDWMLLREEPLVVISPRSLPIEDPHELLTRESFIRYDRRHWGGRLVDAYLQEWRIRPNERFELDALDGIAVMVDRELGISLVPDWAPPWPAGLHLNKKALDAPAFVRRIGLLWIRNSGSIRQVQMFRAQARHALGL